MGTPHIGSQPVQIQDMSAAPGSIVSQDKEHQQLHQDYMNARERHRKLEADWLRRVDEAKEQNHNDL